MENFPKTTINLGGNNAQILGVKLFSGSLAELLNRLIGRISATKKIFIVTPNPEFLVFAYDRPWFKNVLNSADFAVVDGVGLIWAGKFSLQRIPGIDLMEKLCQMAAEKGWKVYLLGGKGNAAELAREKLVSKFQISNFKFQIHVDGGRQLELDKTTGGWDVKSEGVIEEIVTRINRIKPDLLFVAFGMGKQEKFIYDNLGRLNVKLAMGVGGAFDYLSGKVKRAPLLIRKIGFEWLFRLLIQPWRWKRQLNLLRFCWLVSRKR